ncbi:MAG TPA: hypothetical protein VLF67_04255 [Candidatus Saccharimonas sp.]|nr:hypothetical protein [Candidatus Saccharimonas sp.]
MAKMRWWGLAVVLMMAWAGVAKVAEAASTTGLAVTPAVQQVTLKQDQAEVRLEVEFSNFSGVGQSFKLSTTDFGSLDEEGGVAFLGDPADKLSGRYGLAAWMTLEKDALYLPPGASQTVEVVVENKQSLSPGGHYGAVLATAVSDQSPENNSQVGVKQVLSSLVLVSKEGGAVPDLGLISQLGDGGWWRLPGQLEQRFENVGNVHVTPRGVVEVKDPLGRLVRRGALNAESGIVLPESFRRYRTPLVSVGAAWMPGEYTITTTYRYDGTTQTKTLTTQVWYAGMVVVWLVGVGALAAAGGLAWWLWWRPRRRRGRA